MMGVVFAIFYFLIIRPQSKAQKAHREKLSRLKKGDEVVTTGGLIGTIFSVTDELLMVEIADKVRVRIMRSQVSSRLNEGKGDGATDAPAEKGKSA